MSASLDLLYENIAGCTRCPLSRYRTRPVPGVGPETARIMFVGEGPGPEEDAQGEPFIGRAGKVLRGLITELGIPFSDVYLANLVKCYPTDGEPTPRGYYQFREPRLDEIDQCDPFLQAQIDIIRPKVVIPLGRVPSSQWFPGTKMGEVHGILRHTGKYLLAPTYHPSAVARGNVHLRELMLTDIRRAAEVAGVIGEQTSRSGL